MLCSVNQIGKLSAIGFDGGPATSLQDSGRFSDLVSEATWHAPSYESTTVWGLVPNKQTNQTRFVEPA